MWYYRYITKGIAMDTNPQVDEYINSVHEANEAYEEEMRAEGIIVTEEGEK